MFNLGPHSALLSVVVLVVLSWPSPTQNDGDASPEPAQRCSPPGFLFGTSASAQQVEGGVNATGRTASRWDALCRLEGSPLACSNVAGDFVHRYPQDLSLMQRDGYNAFRFSISWSRAMNWDDTTQRMRKNGPGVAFYHALIDDMIAKRLEPVLTIFHWDIPIELSVRGDFTNATIVDHYVEFAELLFTEFGHKVKYWTTFNEPMVYASFLMYDDDPVNEFQVAHNILLSHGSAVLRFREHKTKGLVRRDAVIGMVLNGFGAPLNASNAEDVAAATRYVEYSVGWWLSPLTTGDYPVVMRKRSGDRLPTFTPEQKALVKGSYDLFMYNFYFANPVTDCDSPHATASCKSLQAGWAADLNVDSSCVPNLPGQRNATGRCADHFGYPPDYLDAMEWIHAHDKTAGLLLTENGWCGDESVHNEDQTWYFRTHLQQVHKAITEKNIPIVGYMAWSFMDNYEWGSYDNRYGLYHVAYPTNIGSKDQYEVPQDKLTRTPRDAAKLMSSIATTGCVDVLDEDNQFL